MRPMFSIVFRAGILALSLFALGCQPGADGAGAGGEAKSGNENYKPMVGQQGKDVIWVPTPDSVVAEMLRMAEVKSTDVVLDLGAGDGKIAIAAARDFGATARGVEYNPDMAALATRNAQREGVANKVTIINGDLFEQKFDDATVITLYLLPSLNEKLRPRLLDLKPGTRVVSHDFDMGDWNADNYKALTVDGREHQVFFWIVPAKVQGIWSFAAPTGEPMVLNLQQKYQQVTGGATFGGRQAELTDLRLRGAQISFSLKPAGAATASTVRATIDGDVMTGEIGSPGGQMQRFVAKRGAAPAAAR